MSAVITLLLCALGGGYFGYDIGKSVWQQQAIRKGYAHYHPMTGYFTWGAP